MMSPNVYKKDLDIKSAPKLAIIIDLGIKHMTKDGFVELSRSV